jgi:hypothetical protein
MRDWLIRIVISLARHERGGHPPWLVRALRLGEEISELQSESDEPNAFYEGLTKLVVERKGGIDVGTLYASENLREIQACLQEKRLLSPE